MGEPLVKKGLIAFDFDQTIIDANSDLVVIDMIEGEVPEEAQKLYTEDNWTDYMQAIFKHLHDAGVKKKQFDDLLASLPFVRGLPALLKWLRESDYEIIIISDSNSYFIEHVLSTHGLSQYVTEIFTNPARFDDEGPLRIEWFHVQDSCNLSTKNMCKGQILEEYIAKRKSEQVCFRHHYYCGDGSNDFCPSLRLEEGDVTFPRVGFKLEAKLKQSDSIKATVVPWTNGDEIMEYIKRESN